MGWRGRGGWQGREQVRGGRGSKAWLLHGRCNRCRTAVPAAQSGTCLPLCLPCPGMWHAFQMTAAGCFGGAPVELAEVAMRRGAAFLRAATGEPGAAPAWPERLGWPRVEYHGRWPAAEQRAAVAQSFYDA